MFTFKMMTSFILNHLQDFNKNLNVISISTGDFYTGKYIRNGFANKDNKKFPFIVLMIENELLGIWINTYVANALEMQGAKHGDYLIIEGVQNPKNKNWTTINVKVVYPEFVEEKMRHHHSISHAVESSDQISS